jgi:hypothetical protein
MIWIVTYRETVERPSGSVQVVHIERDDETALVLERPAAHDDINNIEIANLALDQYGLIIDSNNID